MSDSFPGQERSKLCLAQKVPLGVVLCIPPFNYPCALCAPAYNSMLVVASQWQGMAHPQPVQGPALGYYALPLLCGIRSCDTSRQVPICGRAFHALEHCLTNEEDAMCDGSRRAGSTWRSPRSRRR